MATVAARDWLHVDDHAAAIDLVLRHGRQPGWPTTSAPTTSARILDVIHAILDRIDKPRSLIRHVEDRPGHDRRYGLDTTLIREERMGPREVAPAPTPPTRHGRLVRRTP